MPRARRPRPFVPRTDETPPSWLGFFDGSTDMHELLFTDSHATTWLVRQALDASRRRWPGALTSEVGRAGATTGADDVLTTC